MYHSRNKSSNYSQMQAGQSLFDFLKRKKKFALEASLSKSRQKENINVNGSAKKNNEKYKQSVISPRKQCQQTYRETLRESAGGPSIGKNNQETYRSMLSANFNSTTPKRVSFADEKDKEKKLTARSSFIEMISPMKRRHDGSKTPEHCATAKETSIVRQSAKSSNPQEIFYRKNLNNSILTLKQTLQKFLSVSSSIKQKSHSLFVELKPLLKHVQEQSNPNFAKRAQQAKLKLRTFEHLFKQLSIQNGNQLFQQFHRSLSQHLINLQSNLRSGFDKERIDEYKRIREEKDTKIQELLINKQRMQKQIDALNRRLQKVTKETDKIKQSSETIIEKGQHNYSNQLSQLQKKIDQYQLELNAIAKQLDASKQSEKTLQKTVKDLKYLKQQAQRRFIQENVRVKSTKEEFLLNEITILKKQFKGDMEQLTALYTTKQQQHVAIIGELRLQLAQLHKQRSCDKEVEGKIASDAVHSRAEADRIRKQKECLVTDLHRMNEELYQHWLALKDIKTLAVRLHIYAKFSKIYEDLAFNDQLFI